MKRWFLSLGLVVVGSVGALAEEDKTGELVTVAKAEELIGKKVVLVDVRSKREWDSGRLETAVLIDVGGKDFDKKVGQLDRKKPVLVYCRSGARSAKAAKKLKSMGFETVYDLDGGILAWRKAGKAVVK